MPTFDLGQVVGPQGPQGATGPQGPQGIQGTPGPNQITSETSTDFSGLLFGESGGIIAKTIRDTLIPAGQTGSTDPVSSVAVLAGLNGKQDTLTAAQLAAVNSGITSQLVDNLYPTITNFDISGWTGEYNPGFCTLIKINNVYYIKFLKFFYSSQIEAPHDYLIGSHGDLIGANVDVVVMVNDDTNTLLKASRLYASNNGNLYFQLVEKASYGITYCRCCSAIWIV